MYNHKKVSKKAQFSWNKHYDQMLQENNEDHNQPIRDHSGITDWQLQQHGHKETDTSIPFNEKLGDERKGTNEAVVEKALDDNPHVYNHKRNSKPWDSKVGAIDRMDEAYHQKKIKQWNEANEGQDWDTSFWDDYVGKQMIGPTTKMTNNVQTSQLQNHPERFVGLDEDMPINEEYQKDEKLLAKEEEFYKMVEASLKNSDAILFKIYAKAASEKRELTEKEKQMIADVNSAKVRIMAAMDNKIPSKYAIDILKSAQFDEDAIEDFDRLDLVGEEGNEEDLTIEPKIDEFSGDTEYAVYEHGEYEPTSVLAGQPRRTFKDSFTSIEEAKAAYPNAQVFQHSTKTDIRMPDVDPRPDLTRGTGEVWHEDDY